MTGALSAQLFQLLNKKSRCPLVFPQVIKAALAQVKAVADGGVTAADLTRAK